ESTEFHTYLCCVNRGILDDALILAIENHQSLQTQVFVAITREVTLSSNSPASLTLNDHQTFSLCPMDFQSLYTPHADVTRAPDLALLEHATRAEHWPGKGNCPAGDNCPFCHSQSLLAREDNREALLKMLRWYELGSGKRWSFRDLFSLISYLLAGSQATE